VPPRGILAWSPQGPKSRDPAGETNNSEEKLERSEIPTAVGDHPRTLGEMQPLLQKQTQLAGMRGEPSTRPTGPVPRRGILADILSAPASVPATTSEARTLDSRGRVSLSDTATAVGITAGDKVRVDIDVDGVITVTPFVGEALEGRRDTGVLDSRGRLTLPAWVRAYAGITPEDAVMCVAVNEQIQIVGADAFLRLRG